MSLCTIAHPFYTKFASIFGASLSETTMRPNPRWAAAGCPIVPLLEELVGLGYTLHRVWEFELEAVPTGSEGDVQSWFADVGRHNTIDVLLAL